MSYFNSAALSLSSFVRRLLSNDSCHERATALRLSRERWEYRPASATYERMVKSRKLIGR